MLEKLALGTVQLGMEYGAANKNGKPSQETAQDILRLAAKSGIKYIDTARAYGNSETIIGSYDGKFIVSTKLSPLTELSPSSSEEEIIKAVHQSVEQSLTNLGVKQLNILMLHRWEYRANTSIWNTLLELKTKGIIKKLGTSLSTPQEAKEAFADKEIEFIQLPINILDWRWQMQGIDQLALDRPDIMVQARSVLLQGILGSDESCWPNIQGTVAQDILQKLDDLADRFNRKSRVDLCYAYVGALPWIASIVIGVEIEEQLKQNIDLFTNSPLTMEECAICREEFQDVPEQLLNPPLWKE